MSQRSDSIILSQSPHQSLVPRSQTLTKTLNDEDFKQCYGSERQCTEEEREEAGEGVEVVAYFHTQME